MSRGVLCLFKASTVAKLRGRWHFALQNDGGADVEITTNFSVTVVGTH